MKKLLFLTLLVTFTLALAAQEQIVYENASKESYLVKYNTGNDNSQRIINDIIQEIARQPRKNIHSTQFTFSFIAHSRITKKNNNLSIYLELKNFNCQGDVFYREFNLSDALLPSKVSVTVTLIGQNNRVLADFNVPYRSFAGDRNNFEFSYRDTLNQNNFSLRLSNVAFLYDENCKRNFYDRLKVIDNYYLADQKLTRFYSDMEMVHPENIDQLQFAQNVLSNARGFINETDRLDLRRDLDLDYFDPFDFQKRYNRFKGLVNNLEQGVNQTIARLPEIYYNKGLESIVNKDGSTARLMFGKSLEANPYYAPSLYQLARMDLIDGNYEACAIKLQDLFNKMNPDPGTYKFCNELAKNLFDAYMTQGDNFYNGKQYEEALNSYSKTENYFRTMRGFELPTVIYQKISLSRIGIYNNYIQKAGSFLQQAKLQEAENEVNNAITYQKTYPSDITDNKSAMGMLNNIRQVEYKMDITEGKVQLTAKNYPAALEAFQKAEAIERSFVINKSYELPNLLKTAAKPVIVSELNRAIELTSQNQLQEARNISQNMSVLQTTYNLSDDKTLINLFTTLKKKIYSQECLNAQNEFDGHLYNARLKIQSFDYLGADNEFYQAAGVIKLNSTCGIYQGGLDSLRSSVLPAINYQAANQEALKLLGNRYYDKALTKYQDLENYYNRFQVGNYGLKHMPLIDFIKNSENNFIIYCLNFFLNKDELDKSMQLLQVLKARGFKTSKLKNEQKLLGTKLALKDLKSGNRLPPKQSVLQYTNNDNWYKHLKKAYLNAMK